LIFNLGKGREKWGLYQGFFNCKEVYQSESMGEIILTAELVYHVFSVTESAEMALRLFLLQG